MFIIHNTWELDNTVTFMVCGQEFFSVIALHEGFSNSVL